MNKALASFIVPLRLDLSRRGSLPFELLERVTSWRDKAFANPGGVAHLTHIKIPVRVHAHCVWNEEIAGRAAILTHPAQQQIAIWVENADVSRYTALDGTVQVGILPNIPPQA